MQNKTVKSFEMSKNVVNLQKRFSKTRKLSPKMILGKHLYIIRI